MWDPCGFFCLQEILLFLFSLSYVHCLQRILLFLFSLSYVGPMWFPLPAANPFVFVFLKLCGTHVVFWLFCSLSYVGPTWFPLPAANFIPGKRNIFTQI